MQHCARMLLLVLYSRRHGCNRLRAATALITAVTLAIDAGTWGLACDQCDAKTKDERDLACRHTLANQQRFDNMRRMQSAAVRERAGHAAGIAVAYIYNT